MQFSGSAATRPASLSGRFDMRDWLSPRRLTIVTWDQAYVMRHAPGDSYADYDRVLDETMERGHNTLRIDPMPQLLDLSHPEHVNHWKNPRTPDYMPWGWDKAGEGPLGAWLIEFMEKAIAKGFNYTLSSWWGGTEILGDTPSTPVALVPHTHPEGAEIWAKMLRDWQRLFGFAGLVYVDIVNEVPYFLDGFLKRFETETGGSWHESGRPFTPRQIEFLASELNPALAALQREFPQVRFTASIHGDERWLDVPVHFDCLGVHFYSDVDPRWSDRTRFREFMPNLFLKRLGIKSSANGAKRRLMPSRPCCAPHNARNWHRSLPGPSARVCH